MKNKELIEDEFAYSKFASTTARDSALLDEIERLRAVLAAQPVAQAPEGWKLVPVVPTEEMLRAGRLWDNLNEGLNRDRGHAQASYTGLLAAAPSPEASKPVQAEAPSDVVNLILRDMAELDGEVEDPDNTVLICTEQDMRVILERHLATPPAPANVQAEAPSGTTIKRDEWGALSPEAQALLREKVRARTLKAAQGAASIRDVSLGATPPAPCGAVERMEKLEACRRALEIIAVGDAQNPQAQAAEELIALGFWRDIPEARAAIATSPTASGAVEREAWKPVVLSGPCHHICWMPDEETPEERVKVVLISAADYDRACAALASQPLEMQKPVAWRDPRNINPAQGCTYDSATAKQWPHIYSQPLYISTQPEQVVQDCGKKGGA